MDEEDGEDVLILRVCLQIANLPPTNRLFCLTAILAVRPAFLSLSFGDLGDLGIMWTKRAATTCWAQESVFELPIFSDKPPLLLDSHSCHSLSLFLGPLGILGFMKAKRTAKAC